MPQTVTDVFARALWEVDDELMQYLKQPELIKVVDRVNNEFCKKTKVLTKHVAFVTDGSSEYSLAGQVDDGTQFGADILQFFYCTYAGNRMEEHSFEEVMDARITATTKSSDVPIMYCVKYQGKNLWIYFSFGTNPGDEVDLWYYRVPPIGTISKATDVFEFDDKYTDALVAGVKQYAANRLIFKVAKDEKINADVKKTLLQIYVQKVEESKLEWKEKVEDARRQIEGWIEESTATQVLIGSPFLDTDDFYDIDYSGLQ
jgi:hypothetical protein